MPAQIPPQATVNAVLEQLDAAKTRASLQVDGHEIAVTNLDKPLWPGAGSRKPVTKRLLLRYFARVARWMLPHLADRPLFVTRFPNGVDGKSFYQKHWDSPAEFARTVADLLQPRRHRRRLPRSARTWRRCSGWGRWGAWSCTPGSRAPIRRLTRSDRSRRFTGSEAALEQSMLNYPDFVVFDLDPYLYSGARRAGRSRSSTGGPSTAPASSPSGSGSCSRASASRPSSRPRAAPGCISTCRSCATSTSTRRATWRRPSRGTRRASGPRT